MQMEHHSDQLSMARMQDRIRQLQEDLDMERELRHRIEREKGDLSINVIQMHERLEEAEAGVDGHIEMNRKRDTEMHKLRKMLEDAHLESEDSMHMLKKKHAESTQELADQLESTTKSRAKLEKEKVKLQNETYELMSQIESSNKDRSSLQKNCEKFELQAHELSLKIEELNRSVSDISSQKSRLSQENIQMLKEVQELKVSLESMQYTKHQVQTSLNETTRRLEEEDRRRQTLEQQLHSAEAELQSVRAQADEEAEVRLELERQLVKLRAEADSWRTRYENEATARSEEVAEIGRKYLHKMQEQEEQIEKLMSKLAQTEKQKSRLQSEVEVLIIDLEKANGICRELQKRIEQLEKINHDLKNKVDEIDAMYEQSQRDSRSKSSEIQRLVVENDKIKEQNNNLGRENKKLGDENGELKSALTELTRRYHELEMENKRLDNERQELASAYRDAEAGRRAEEQRAQSLIVELNTAKHEFEKTLSYKEEELESVKKSLTMEIEQLNGRLADTEAKMKSELTRLKKKMQTIITELEMSLDGANKNNIDLQKQLKKISMQLTETNAQCEDMQRQLQAAVDQYAVAQRRAQALAAENDQIHDTLEQTQRHKRAAEDLVDEFRAKVNDLQTANVGLTSARAKMEQELTNLTSDYEDVTKDFKMCEERFLRVQNELKHTIEHLHEEQERLVKVETIKKSLEVEVKNLTVRLEEVEASAIAGGKRAISKLEARLRDIEMEFDSEKRKNSEAIAVLRKKDRYIKEMMIQMEEDQKNVQLLQDALDKATQKVNLFKKQLQEQEQMSAQSVSRVRKFQRDLEVAEERAEAAENNLSMIRNRHRSFVTQTVVPGAATYIKETRIVEEQ